MLNNFRFPRYYPNTNILLILILENIRDTDTFQVQRAWIWKVDFFFFVHTASDNYCQTSILKNLHCQWDLQWPPMGKYPIRPRSFSKNTWQVPWLRLPWLHREFKRCWQTKKIWGPVLKMNNWILVVLLVISSRSQVALPCQAADHATVSNTVAHNPRCSQGFSLCLTPRLAFVLEKPCILKKSQTTLASFVTWC